LNTLSFKQHIENLFKNSQKFSDNDGNLDIPKILESIEKIDIELIKILKEDEKAKKEFFTQIDDIYILNQNKLIEFFTLNDYMKNGSYTAYPNKIGLIKKDNFIKKFDDVVLAFPHKDCVLEGGQTKDDDKKKEVFYNEIISSDEINRLFEPKVLTNIKRYSKDNIEKNSMIKNDDNLIIKGNNLIALHSLKKKFAGKVKLIYIDPPYNTGSDSFGYNDNFNHSTWLTFMKNRLEVAEKFLDYASGVIAVQCSFHEYPYLKVIMDEQFDKKNYKCTFHIKVRHPDRVLTGDKEFNDIIEYILFYSKNENYKFPTKKEIKTNDEYIYKIELLDTPELITCGSKIVEVYTPNKYRQIVCEPSSNNLKTISVRGSIREKNSSGRFFVKYLESLSNEYPPLTLFKVPDMGDDIFNYRYFHLPKDGNKNGTYYQGKPTSSEITIKPYANFYDFEKDYNMVSSEREVDFRNGKKPESLLSFLMELFTNKNDLIMDFHLGSATTCAVAHKMGRRYIGIEQMDYIEDVAVERLKKVIDGEQGGISKTVNWNGGGDFVYAELKTIDTFKDVEIGALNKNMQYLPISEIEDESYNVSKEEIAINKAFYGIENE
jgi:adenine-specific DNA-methyltransferase